jgi:hypothetical protein
VRQAFPSATILKPSVLVGTEDRMFNSFARLAMNLPYFPLTGRDAQVQVHCFCNLSLELAELCSPWSASQLVTWTCHMR